MNRTFLLLIAIGGVALGSTATLADTKEKPDAAVRCDANQDSLNACAERKLQRAEAAMNRAMTSLLEIVRGSDSGALLKESQELWLKFREADCRYVVSGLTPDGTMRDQWQNDCRARRTEGRTLQLKEMAQCVSAGCPGQ